MLEGCVVIVEVEFWVFGDVTPFSCAFLAVALGTKHLQIILFQHLAVESNSSVVGPPTVRVSNWFLAVEFEVACFAALDALVSKLTEYLSAQFTRPSHLARAQAIPLATYRCQQAARL
jgi:hypothetical protein